MRELELKNILKVDEREFLISTISMNIRHSWFDDDKEKIVYETMVFEVKDNDVMYDKPIFSERYNMKDEAISEHSAIIKDPKAFFII